MLGALLRSILWLALIGIAVFGVLLLGSFLLATPVGVVILAFALIWGIGWMFSAAREADISRSTGDIRDEDDIRDQKASGGNQALCPVHKFLSGDVVDTTDSHVNVVVPCPRCTPGLSVRGLCPTHSQKLSEYREQHIQQHGVANRPTDPGDPPDPPGLLTGSAQDWYRKYKSWEREKRAYESDKASYEANRDWRAPAEWVQDVRSCEDCATSGSASKGSPPPVMTVGTVVGVTPDGHGVVEVSAQDERIPFSETDVNGSMPTEGDRVSLVFKRTADGVEVKRLVARSTDE